MLLLDQLLRSPSLYALCFKGVRLSFQAAMSFVALRPFTDSNRPPSYQASTNEQESNLHFLVFIPHDPSDCSALCLSALRWLSLLRKE